jgi:putative hemolysin
MSNYFIYNILVLLFILTSIFFSALETAIIASRRLSLETLSNSGKKSAVRSLYIIDNIDTALTMVLIGNNISNICATAFITFVVTKALHFDDSMLLGVTLVQTVFFLVFCEITPKIVAKSKAEKFLMIVSSLAIFLMKIMTPIIKVSLFFTRFIAGGIMSVNVTKDPVKSRDDIDAFFQIGKNEGVIDEDRHEYLEEILSFKHTLAYEVMTPIIDVISVGVNTSIRELVNLIASKKFSRIPVYEGEEDNFIGYVYYKDIVLSKPDSIKDIILPPVFIPETKNIFEIFKDIQKKRHPFYFVVNEYGDTTGILTFEDIAEEIVGDIQTDDHPEEKYISQVSDRKFILSGRMDIDYFQRYFSLKIEKHHFETLAGFLLSLFGKIPATGERIKYGDCEFIIDKMTGRTIEWVQFILPPKDK